MNITQKTLKKLAKAGITSTAKASQIKASLAEITDEEPSKQDIKDIREGLSVMEEMAGEQEEASPDELLAQAKKALKEMKAGDERYSNAVEVTEASPNGRPVRVTVKCQDPQVDSEGTSVCSKTREVAIQDVFQVKRCDSCQSRYTQIYRNKLARERRQRHRDLESKAAAKPKSSKRKKRETAGAEA